MHFEQDNPGGKWLKEEIAYSRSQGRDQYAVPKRFGAITGHFDEKVMLPVSLLSKVPGQHHEQAKVRHTTLSWLVEYGRKYGCFPPGHDAGTYDPYIEVDYDGKPWVNEGNHRIMAASQLGWDYVPVEVRYFSGGEQQEGVLSPMAVISMDAKARALGRTPIHYGGRSRGEREDYRLFIVNEFRAEVRAGSGIVLFELSVHDELVEKGIIQCLHDTEGIRRHLLSIKLMRDGDGLEHESSYHESATLAYA